MSTTTHTKFVTYGAELESQVILNTSFSIDPTKRTGTLTITFKNGTKYEYLEVPEMVFLGLLHAKSHGQYFIDHIKTNYATA
jgi:hypothetical protein